MEPPTSGSGKLVSSPEKPMEKLDFNWKWYGIVWGLGKWYRIWIFQLKNYGSVWISGKRKCDGILMNCVDLLEINGELNELYVI